MLSLKPECQFLREEQTPTNSWQKSPSGPSLLLPALSLCCKANPQAAPSLCPHLRPTLQQSLALLLRRSPATLHLAHGLSDQVEGESESTPHSLLDSCPGLSLSPKAGPGHPIEGFLSTSVLLKVWSCNHQRLLGTY